MLRAGEIAIRIDTGAEPVRPQKRSQREIDLGQQFRFHLTPVFQIRLRHRRLVIAGCARTVQKMTAGIDDRHRFRCQPVHRAGNQIGHRVHAARPQGNRTPQFENNGCLGRLPCIQKYRIFCERDVDARLFHFRQRGHGTFQLTFQCAPVVDLLGKIARSQIVAVENFKSDTPGLGQSRTGQRQPRFRNAFGGHKNGGTGFVQFVFDARLADFLRHGGSVLRCQRAVEHAKGAVMHPPRHAETDRGEQRGNKDERYLLAAA